MAEQRTDFLQVVMLFQHIYGDAMPEIVRLQRRATDGTAAHLAEAPDILSGHGRTRLTDNPSRGGGSVILGVLSNQGSKHGENQPQSRGACHWKREIIIQAAKGNQLAQGAT